MWVADGGGNYRKVYTYNMPPPLPTAPNDLTATAVDGYIALSWTDPHPKPTSAATSTGTA